MNRPNVTQRQIDDSLKGLLLEVHQDNSGFPPLASRFYRGNCEQAISTAESFGWIAVSRSSDALSGDYASVTITSAGCDALGLADIGRRGFKAFLFNILKHT